MAATVTTVLVGLALCGLLLAIIYEIERRR